MNNMPHQYNKKPTSTAKVRYAAARQNLLIMICLTAINLLLILTNSSIVFAISAFLPQYIVSLGVELSEVYSLSYVVNIIFTIIAIVPISLYVMCYFLSKHSHIWMTVALILFSVDCLVLALYMFKAESGSFLIDIIFHVYIMYFLISGVRNGKGAFAPEDQTQKSTSLYEVMPIPEEINNSDGTIIHTPTDEEFPNKDENKNS